MHLQMLIDSTVRSGGLQQALRAALQAACMNKTLKQWHSTNTNFP